MSDVGFYINLQVLETIEVTDFKDVKKTVARLIDLYINNYGKNDFSLRIILPRDEKNLIKTRQIGMAIQSEFALVLKRKKIRVQLREIKYIHDNNHFGWLLLHPQIFESLKR